MAEQLVRPTADHDVMADIREGMEVVDRDGKKAGKVTAVFMGAEADARGTGMVAQTADVPPGLHQGSLPGDFDSIFRDNENIPRVLVNRMQSNGFARVDGGLLKGTRYALREHIASVAEGRVHLHVAQNEMIKP